MPVDVAEEMRRSLYRESSHDLVEFEGRWLTAGALAAVANQIEDLARSYGLAASVSIAVVARNLPGHVAAVCGLIGNNRPISMIYAFQSGDALARDISALRPGAILASLDDWAPIVVKAAGVVGSLGLALSPNLDVTVVVAPHSGRIDPEGDYHSLPEAGVEMLSSGTTGMPKRIFHRASVLVRSIESIADTGSGMQHLPPDLLFWPLGHSGGVNQLVAAMVRRKRIVLLEKFTVDGVMDAIKRHRPPNIALTPTMLRMLVDADVSRDDLSSITAIYGGSAPLDVDLQDQAEAKYGIPVIWALGATEFCGVAISWTLDLKKKFGDAKRGSVGRPIHGVEVRAVNAITGDALPPGVDGYMEVRIASVGPTWIHTTDLICIDEDGFVFHRGRGDGAIIRGGFKIMPEKINEILRLHPSVEDAAVIGVADERLGHVPVAVFTVRSGAAVPSDRELEALLRRYLTAPEIPAKFLMLDEMPYTPSMKADLTAVRRLVERASNA